MEKLTMSVLEAARALGISRSLAYRAANRGELPGAFRIGKRIVVSRAAVDAVLQGAIAIPKAAE